MLFDAHSPLIRFYRKKGKARGKPIVIEDDPDNYTYEPEPEVQEVLTPDGVESFHSDRGRGRSGRGGLVGGRSRRDITVSFDPNQFLNVEPEPELNLNSAEEIPPESEAREFEVNDPQPTPEESVQMPIRQLPDDSFETLRINQVKAFEMYRNVVLQCYNELCCKEI